MGATEAGGDAARRPRGPSRLQVVAGTGRLFRTGSRLLFSPAAVGAEHLETLSAVDDLDLLSELLGDPFVAVDWSGDLQVVVNGDLAAGTALPSQPTIDRTADQRSAERRLMLVPGGADPAAFADTILDSGCIPAGGFVLFVDESNRLTSPPADLPGVSAQAPRDPIEALRSLRSAARGTGPGEAAGPEPAPPADLPAPATEPSIEPSAAARTAPDGALPPGVLLVDFIGEQHHLAPGEHLTFGRAAELAIDDNPHLHRTLGRFEHAKGHWWIRNVGRAIPLQLADADSRSKLVAASGTAVIISFERSVLSFDAGGTSYALDLRIGQTPDASRPAPSSESNDPLSGDTVMSSGTLTDAQRLALVALAEPALRNPHRAIEIPANKVAADRLGWTTTQWNRKVDNLCDKFSKLGVRGLRGAQGALASDRRRLLVEHCIATGVIGPDDLALLPPG